MADKKDIWLNSAISPRLFGQEGLDDYNEALSKLREAAAVIAPDGRLVTFVTTQRDKFSPIDKLAANLAMSKSIYNERSLTSDPSIGVELAEILTHVKAINNIIDKRKKQRKPYKGGKK